MNRPGARLLRGALNQASLILFALVFAGFGSLSAKFLSPANLLNILLQSAPTVIVAVGMTFVLLTGGVDLSVGAVMFVGAALAGKAAPGGAGPAAAVGLMLAAGALLGLGNGFLVARLKVIPFVVTLAVMSIGRGFGLWLTETRALNLSNEFLQVGAARVLGVPVPVLLAGAVLVTATVVLGATPFGRQLYAVGQNAAAARRAGVNTRRILLIAYVLSGVCAGLGGFLSLAQLGAVSSKFGENYEFKAIAAAVLGGASLQGGRGRIFPGALLGATLIQAVENGLVILNADPYLYPLVTSAVIFLAVLVDATRTSLLAESHRRQIRVEP